MVVDPVEMQPQHVLPVHRLGKHGAPHLPQPRRAAHRGKTQPGQQHPAGERLSGQCVHAAHKADQHQRQCAVGVQQRQGQHQQRQRQPQTALRLKAEPPYQVQCGQQNAPAEQGGPLGNEQVHHRIDPQHVVGHIVGGCGVKPCEDGGEFLPAAQKPHKAEPAAHQKQPERQTRLGGAVQHPPRQLPHHAVHRRKGRQHGQQVGGAQVGPHQQKHRGNALAQKRIPEPVFAAQKGIIGREFSCHRDVFDETQMHCHIAVAALAGAVGPAHLMQHMGGKQVTGHGKKRQHTAQHRPPVRSGAGQTAPQPPAQQ